jgi:hypothetical protein
MKNEISARLMYLKALLFLAICLTSLTIILLENPSLKLAALLALALWSAARAYYFAFYVLEKYIDPTYRFSGLFALTKYLLQKRKSQ